MDATLRNSYPTDLTEARWEIIAGLLPPAKHGGRTRTVNLREVVHTILYLNRTGCQWDMLPHDLQRSLNLAISPLRILLSPQSSSRGLMPHGLSGALILLKELTVKYPLRCDWLAVAVVLFCLVTASAGRAQDVLGMPTPIDPQKPGSVVLHGGGTVTDDVFDRFVELAGGKNARILFVPCAGYSRESYSSDEAFLAAVGSRYGSWPSLVREGRAQSFQFLFTDKRADADDATFCRPLESATGVWFSGGWQSRLKYRFVGEYPAQTRFQKALRGVMERGGVVGGTSAGTAAIPEVMTMWEERRHSQAPALAVPAHGLGLLTKAIVEQHFDVRGGRMERFTGLLRDSATLDKLVARRGAGEQMIGLAVEERTALIAHGNLLQVLGTGAAHVFVKSRVGRTTSWHEIRAGESAQLTNNTRGMNEAMIGEIALSR